MNKEKAEIGMKWKQGNHYKQAHKDIKLCTKHMNSKSFKTFF